MGGGVNKSPLEMLMELRQVREELPPAVVNFVNSTQLLVDDGMDDAIDVDTLRKCYMKCVGLKGLPARPKQGMSFPPFVQMVNELEEGSMMLVSDSDRDFVAGLKMLVEMQEQITASDLARLQKIYAAFLQNQHMGSSIRD